MSIATDAGAALAPDRAAAEEFLRWLDPEAQGFQTFDDGEAKRRELARTLHGSLDQHWPTLCDLSAKGAGIFITVNATDLKGRKTKNITGVRSLFVDLDDAPLTNFARLALEPHAGVTTSLERYHLYWKVDGIALEEFAGIQKRLAALMGGDPKVSDLPRVLRLPGFPHQKGAPFMVRAGSSNAPATSRDEFLAALAAAEQAHSILEADAKRDAPEPTNVLQGPFAPGREYLRRIALTNKRSGFNEAAGNVTSPPPLNEHEIKRVTSALKLISSEDRDTWLKVGMALHWTGWTRLGISRQLWDGWSKTSPKFNEQVQDATWQSFDRGYGSTKITLGTLFHMAKEKGWVDPTPVAPAPVTPVAPAAPPKQPERRTVIDLAGGDLKADVDRPEDVLLREGAPVFVRDCSLVAPVIVDHIDAVGGGTTKQARFHEYSVASMRGLLSDHVIFRKWVSPTKAIHVYPQKEIAEQILSRADAGKSRFPKIDAIIPSPTLRPDGSVLREPGYDPATRLYLMPNENFALPPIPEEPTREDALKALKLFDPLLAEFPLETAVDRAVALSGIMTTVLRGSIDRAPLHAIRAPTMGTGKTYLVHVISTIATGEKCAALAAGEDTAELRKRLEGLLREGAPLASIDNCDREIGGDLLEQMCTESKVSFRVMGLNRMLTCKCRVMLFATGNNLRLTTGMMRRSLLCRMDAKIERPETRKFRGDPLAAARAHRAEFVAAVLVIARAWHLAKARSERVEYTPLSGFDLWTKRVREPLIWLGCRDPVESQESIRKEDMTAADIRVLFANWPGDGLLSATDLINATGLGSQELREVLFRRAGAGKDSILSSKLGVWLSSIEGRPIDGKKLTIKRSDKYGNRYQLVMCDV